MIKLVFIHIKIILNINIKLYSNKKKIFVKFYKYIIIFILCIYIIIFIII